MVKFRLLHAYFKGQMGRRATLKGMDYSSVKDLANQQQEVIKYVICMRRRFGKFARFDLIS